MQKMSYVVGAIIIVAFLALTVQSIRQKIATNSDNVATTANENTNADSVLGDLNSDVLDYLNQAASETEAEATNANTNSNVTGSNTINTQQAFCTDNLTSLQDIAWFKTFSATHEELDKEAATIVSLCSTTNNTKIVFLDYNEAQKTEQIGWWEQKTNALNKLDSLTIERATTQVPAAETYFGLHGWINENQFSLSRHPSAETRNYSLFNVNQLVEKPVSECAVTTTQLVCSAAEHDAWGCTIGQTSSQTQETCTDVEE
ncbi:MAG: hypothetical protein A3F54_03425 [Candidatus Kerfeldbacteria bacterium RIFCSPHIGHO2_12_FULL_48_17]|uniref:Uncharacterized protein n=1 Tax=Candidatus Kerfeldbacteria bacterium RIFCSPHIGHO2_12_FULL_48_17 TaxID=1798542 RepID=A0A1G2B4X1_9BACT|nr:MAG: hypothetical protein A3F54_03425 [Candidatus Kerfeldbacteria bacterium RIFCSPHIGHO2_12_FULL_48_17]